MGRGFGGTRGALRGRNQRRRRSHPGDRWFAVADRLFGAHGGPADHRHREPPGDVRRRDCRARCGGRPACPGPDPWTLSAELGALHGWWLGGDAQRGPAVVGLWGDRGAVRGRNRGGAGRHAGDAVPPRFGGGPGPATGNPGQRREAGDPHRGRPARRAPPLEGDVPDVLPARLGAGTRVHPGPCAGPAPSRDGAHLDARRDVDEPRSCRPRADVSRPAPVPHGPRRRSGALHGPARTCRAAPRHGRDVCRSARDCPRVRCGPGAGDVRAPVAAEPLPHAVPAQHAVGRRLRDRYARDGGRLGPSPGHGGVARAGDPARPGRR